MKHIIYSLIILSLTLITFSCNDDDDNINPNNDITPISIIGCTNPDAVNYDENATEDDGSCIILGCTDENATNYNMDATNDDGTCQYSVEYLLNGQWDIVSLEYATEVDLSDIPTVGQLLGVQDINGEAVNAGSWIFQIDGVYENNLSFTTEPLNIATFEVPGIPIDYSTNGTWSLNDDSSILTTNDNNTSTTAYYNILSIQNDVAFMSGIIPFSQEIMGFSFDLEIEIEMQLQKQ